VGNGAEKAQNARSRAASSARLVKVAPGMETLYIRAMNASFFSFTHLLRQGLLRL
jgi:hypothetical protein